MKTVQASRTIPLRPQWAWHYLCDVLRWDLFLPFVNEVRRLEGGRFELGLNDERSCQMKLSLREPTERLEWVTTDPNFVGGAIVVERLGFRTGVTIQLDLEDIPNPAINLRDVQTELEAGLDRLVLHLSDREPGEPSTHPVRTAAGSPAGGSPAGGSQSINAEDVSRLPSRSR